MFTGGVGTLVKGGTARGSDFNTMIDEREDKKFQKK